MEHWQTRARSQLTSFPSGTLFLISESELRISNCFLPPRIVLWRHSFDIVGGVGNDKPRVVRGIGRSSDLRHLLHLYAESCELVRTTAGDTVMMSSPLHSQESLGSPHRHPGDPDDVENLKGNMFSQPFYTQVSQPLVPKHKRDPLHSKQPRMLQHTNLVQERNIPDVSSLLLATAKSVPLPIEYAEHLVDTPECTKQVAVSLQSCDGIQKAEGSSAGLEDLAGMPGRSVPPIVKSELWPGGRTSLVNGRHLPRYLTKIGKAQQEILAAPLAWQPSKADRRIRGSVPNQVLTDFTELADKTAEKVRRAEILEREPSPASGTSNEDVQSRRETTNGISDEASESSKSPPTVILPWSPTPRSSAAPEPLLPDNSSPPQAPQRRLLPSLLHEDSPIASVDPESLQQYREKEKLSSPSQGKQTIGEVGPALGRRCLTLCTTEVAVRQDCIRGCLVW